MEPHERGSGCRAGWFCKAIARRSQRNLQITGKGKSNQVHPIVCYQVLFFSGLFL